MYLRRCEVHSGQHPRPGTASDKFTALLVYCASRVSVEGGRAGQLFPRTGRCLHLQQTPVKIKFKPIISIVYLHCSEPTTNILSAPN